MRSRIATSRAARAASIAVAASLAAAVPASGAWSPSVRVDNTGEEFTAVTSGDVGGNGRAVAFFVQGRVGGGPSLFATDSVAGPPAWTAPRSVVLPDGVSSGASRVRVLPNGDARGMLAAGTSAYPLRWDASGQPSVAATPALTGIAGVSLRVAVSPDGVTHAVAATAGSSPTLEYVRIAPDGAASAPQSLGAGAEADLAASAAGVAVAYTRTLASGEKRVVVRRRLGSAEEFSAEAAGQVATSNPADQPSVALAPNGDVTVAFRETPPRLGGQIPQPTPVRYARWPVGGEGVAAPRDLSQPPAPPQPAQTGPNNSAPRAVADDAGRVTFAWEARPQQGGVEVVAAELVNGVVSQPQNLGEGARVALGVSPTGHAVLLFHQPASQAPSTVALERPTGNVWGGRRTLDLTGAGAGVSVFTFVPRLAVSAAQADAFFLQQLGPDGSQRAGAVAARNALPTAAPEEQPVTDARGCPPGNRTRAGGDGDDMLAGTDGDDNLLGGAGNDRLAGLQGNDCLRGEQGADDLGGGVGNDQLVGGDGNDVARGDEGDDALDGEAGDDVLAGGIGVDRVVGGPGADRISGGQGRDEADGGPDADRMFLGDGDDIARGGDGDDVISVGAGTDRAFGEGGNDRMRGSSGRARLDGGDGADRLRGGAGRDLLIGGAGLDTLFGLAGHDLLIGGDDIDVVKGGDGNDRIAGRAGNDRLRGGPGRDRITGGAGDDRVWGDGGRDRIVTGSGQDIVHAADGERDVVICGRDRDRVVADRGDRIARSCETVRFRAVSRRR